MLRFASRLVLQGTFRWVTLGFLRTGHSHENIDAVFGQLAMVLVQNRFDTPEDIVEIVERL